MNPIVESYLSRPLIGIVALSTLVLMALWYSARRYGDIANPISGAIATHVAVTCLISPIAFYVWQARNVASDRALAIVATGSCVFVVAIVAGAVTPAPWLRRLVKLPLGPNRKVNVGTRSKTLALAAVLSSIALFSAMAVAGGGGLVWLESPRDAYIANRVGVGVLWSAASWCLAVAVLALSWRCRSPLKRAIIVGVGALAGLTFGSKAVPLNMVLLAVLYQHLMIRPIGRLTVAVIASLLVGAVAYLLRLQGNHIGAPLTVRYFADYTYTACRGIESLGAEGAWFLGHAWFSSLWEYVPRALAPTKPFAYGVGLLHEALAPGMAARGHTPGVPAWMLGFAELGWAGIALSGFAIGKFHDAVHAVLRRRGLNFANFILYVQVVMYPVLIYSNIISTLAIYWVLIIVLSRRHNGAGTAAGSCEVVVRSAGDADQAG